MNSLGCYELFCTWAVLVEVIITDTANPLLLYGVINVNIASDCLGPAHLQAETLN